MHPGQHAAEDPQRPAVVMAGSGRTMTYAELEAGSNRLAHLFRARGLAPGDHVAVLLPNDVRYFEVVWAALRSGLYITPINWHLGVDEAGYIIEDCDAEALITSLQLEGVVGRLGSYLDGVRCRLSVDGAFDGFELLDDATAGLPGTPIDGEVEGSFMFYSSGTTGRPKGIKPPLSGAPFGRPNPLMALITGMYGIDESSTYLSPAPLYHAAPLGWSSAVQRIGGTVVVMERFDAAGALRAIEEHQVTHAQFVPTHFIRMLKLPPAERAAHDHSSLRMVVHAAAPCPVEVKRQMIDWWGPIVYEYYAGSEGNGFCAVAPEEWLAKPGTVGKPILGIVHIVGEDGVEVGPGEVGQLWFESPTQFEYYKDPAKTQATFDEHGWSTLGDVGYVDEDGYVFLTDRVSHMIISGGVNIYPQEIEDVLVMHPLVADAAVIGVPDADMGEAVKAVVQLANGQQPSADLAAALIAHCREHIAGYKCPRTVDFVDELPRLPTGKLLKRKLRDDYARQAATDAP